MFSSYRAETGPYFIPGSPHVVAHPRRLSLTTSWTWGGRCSHSSPSPWPSTSAKRAVALGFTRPVRPKQYVLFSAACTLNMHTRRITRYRHGKSTRKSSLLATAGGKGPEIRSKLVSQASVNRTGTLYEDLLLDLDRLLATDTAFMLGPWLASARALGGDATDCTGTVVGDLSSCADLGSSNLFCFALQNPPTAISHPTLRDRTASCVI